MPRAIAPAHADPRLLPAPCARRSQAAALAQVGGQRRLLTPLLACALVTTLVLGAVVAMAPSPALAATTLIARCDGVALRGKPRSSSTLKARIPAGTAVVANAKVSGGHWSSTCGGSSSSGHHWYRIVSVNGKSVSKLYGRQYVYARTGTLRGVTIIPLQAACGGVRLRTSASTTATTKVKLTDGTRVTSTGSVTGGSWTGSCSSPTATGKAWYRITAIGGKSVSSLYGVSALYGARSLFEAPTTTSSTPSPTPTPTPNPTPTPTPKPSYIEGIDVSHWQGTINWVKVAAAGKRFAFMKASDSTDYVDPTYATNRAQAKANGLYVGAYHFARPDTTLGDAVAEADHFVDTAAWKSGELLPVLDLEQTGGLGTAKLQAWVQAFLDRVYARTGVRAMIYTSPSFWSNNMGNTQSFAAGGYKTLWIAHWTTASAPTVPAGNWGGNGWTFWQYTSDGSVAGISGRVDLDRYKVADFTPVLVK